VASVKDAIWVDGWAYCWRCTDPARLLRDRAALAWQTPRTPPGWAAIAPAWVKDGLGLYRRPGAPTRPRGDVAKQEPPGDPPPDAFHRVVPLTGAERLRGDDNLVRLPVEMRCRCSALNRVADPKRMG